MLDLVNLSRLHFAVVTVYHFLFVPLTLGLSIFVAIFETLAFVKKDDGWQKLAAFFGQLFLINFAVGVVTGLVQEFQFGMNWSSYSRFVGDIFGAPLAIEALAAFFLESTFLGIWVFGRHKLSPKVHVASIWMVAIASNLSAFWILVANSFMQNPRGFAIVNGKAHMTSFLALITNPKVFYEFPHVIFAGLTTAAVFIMGVSAYRIYKKQNPELFLRTLSFSTVAALISLIAVTIIGDLQSKYLIKIQPMKMAAAEAIWETEQPASLSVFAIVDGKAYRNHINITVPKMLSFMSYSNFTGSFPGINELQAEAVQRFGPGNYIPPVALIYWCFRIMVAGGAVLIIATFIVMWFMRKKNILTNPWLLRGIIALIPIPYICNSTGWIMAEVGRQPWIVYNILLVKDGVSRSNTPAMVLTTLIGFAVVYGILACIDGYLLITFARKEIKEGAQ